MTTLSWFDYVHLWVRTIPLLFLCFSCVIVSNFEEVDVNFFYLASIRSV